METLTDFRSRVQEVLSTIPADDLAFNADEFWMIRTFYEHLEFYAEKNRLFNTAIALPLARGLHNGTYRKLSIMRNGASFRPPYVIHCLTVCKMLADFWLPITREEEDILLASALCHDMMEDIPFPNGGKELITEYHLDPRVYDTVRLVSKRKGFSMEEEKAYFDGIQENRLALLIKLSDRGHNVTDLYNMSDRKISDYIEETRTYFLPMCEYARAHYPELNEVTEILQDQMICLTKTVEMMAEKHSRINQELNRHLQELRVENLRLRTELINLREKG